MVLFTERLMFTLLFSVYKKLRSNGHENKDFMYDLQRLLWL